MGEGGQDVNLRPPGYEHREPGSSPYDASPPSPLVADSTASTSHSSSPMRLCPRVSRSRIWSRLVRPSLRGPQSVGEAADVLDQVGVLHLMRVRLPIQLNSLFG